MIQLPFCQQEDGLVLHKSFLQKKKMALRSHVLKMENS